MEWGDVPTWVGANLTAAAVSLALATTSADRHERTAERRDKAKQQARLVVALPHPDGDPSGPVTLGNFSDKPVFRVRARQATDITATAYRTITIRSGFRDDSIVDILEPGATYELLAKVIDFVDVPADPEGNHKEIVRLNGPIEVEFTDALGARWRKSYRFVGYMDSDPEQVTGR